MSRSDIRAGSAFVELLLKGEGKFASGLRAAGQKLASFAKGAAVAGAAVAAAAVGGVAVGLKQFISMGSALDDMSQRTGMSVESLSELKHAAEQSGASLTDIEAAARNMAKKGLDVSKFDQYAASIAAIEDPTKRAEKAMEIWGKSGTKLLPMVNDLQALRQEARDMGLVMSGEAAGSAARLGDMFDKLWATVKMATAAVGEAVAPFVEMALPTIQSFATGALLAIKSAGEFIRENISTVTNFISTAWQATVDFVGPIVGAWAATISEAFNAVWSVAQSVWGGVQSIIASVWGNVSENTGGVMQWLQDTIIGVFSAISFAINNWQLMLQIAFKSAQVAVVTFVNQTVHFFGTVLPAWLAWFRDNWRDVFTDILNMTATIAGNIWTNLKNLWDGIVRLFKGEGFSFEWTPLTEGFQSAIKELPKIAEREMGPLEKSLKDELDSLSGELGKKWEDHGNKFAKKIAKFTPTEATFSAIVKGQDEETKRRERQVTEAAAALPGKKKEVFGAFTASALLAGAGAGGDKTSTEVKELRKEARQHHRELVRSIREGGKLA
jgi:hypothetical protein